MTKAVVKASNKPVYIFALRSNVTSVGENIRPKEKAPRILEMEEPRILPKAREEWFWLMEAMTTASYDTIIH